MMSPLIHQSIDKLMDRFGKRIKDDKSFDIFMDFKCLSLDVIASTVFSYNTDIFNTKAEDSPFLYHVYKVTLNFNMISIMKQFQYAIVYSVS